MQTASRSPGRLFAIGYAAKFGNVRGGLRLANHCAKNAKTIGEPLQLFQRSLDCVPIFLHGVCRQERKFERSMDNRKRLRRLVQSA
jgi:hypothetical protein